MNLYQRDGVNYRELADHEIVQPGDFIFRSDAPYVESWTRCDTTVGKSVADNRNNCYEGFVWVREVDPLIAAMLESKGETDG